MAKNDDECSDFGKVLANTIRDVEKENRLTCFFAALKTIGDTSKQLAAASQTTPLQLHSLLQAAGAASTQPPPMMPPQIVQSPPQGSQLHVPPPPTTSSSFFFFLGYNRHMSDAEVQAFIQANNPFYGSS